MHLLEKSNYIKAYEYLTALYTKHQIYENVKNGAK